MSKMQIAISHTDAHRILLRHHDVLIATVEHFERVDLSMRPAEEVAVIQRVLARDSERLRLISRKLSQHDVLLERLWAACSGQVPPPAGR